MASATLGSPIAAPLTWSRSPEADTLEASGIGQRIQDGLALPASATDVWDNGTYTPTGNKERVPQGVEWASWPQKFTVDVRHFQAIFTLPIDFNPPSTSGVLRSPDYSNDIVPINDNLYVFVNGVEQFRGGTSYGAPNAWPFFANETDGWYIPDGIRLVNGFQAGLNVIDIVTEERAAWGGLGRLQLLLQQSPCITSPHDGVSTCGMEPGDVLLSHTKSLIYEAENLMFGGYWSHAGIYLGVNEIVESVADGVQEKLITDSGFWDTEDWAILRPKSATSTQRAAAAQWAATQKGKPYNWNYLLPGCTMPFPDCAGSYYCSQLVWQAYQYEGFDIEQNAPGSLTAVAPAELYNTSKMDVIDQPALRRALLSVHSPADLYATDPQGRHVGVDPHTGATVNEIPGVFFSGAGTEPQFMSIPDMDGNWQVQLIGTGTGSYEFTAATVDPNGAVETSLSGTTSIGHIDSYSLSYPAQAGEPITVGPASPVGGIAELPEFAGASAEQASGPAQGSGWSVGNYAALASGLAAAAVATACGACYARRRWLHRRA